MNDNDGNNIDGKAVIEAFNRAFNPAAGAFANAVEAFVTAFNAQHKDLQDVYIGIGQAAQELEPYPMRERIKGWIWNSIYYPCKLIFKPFTVWYIAGAVSAAWEDAAEEKD